MLKLSIVINGLTVICSIIYDIIIKMVKIKQVESVSISLYYVFISPLLPSPSIFNIIATNCYAMNDNSSGLLLMPAAKTSTKIQNRRNVLP